MVDASQTDGSAGTPAPPAPPQGPTPAATPDVVHQRCAALLDQTGQPLVLADRQLRIEHVNHAFEELLGFSRAELIGRSVQELTPPEWQETTALAMRQLAETGRPQRYEKCYRHRDGRAIPVSLVTDYDRDETGEIRGSYAFVSDISERQAAEAALRASEERFRQLFDEAPFGYHITDTDGTILSVNRTECEMLGYPAERLVGTSMFDYVVEGQREAARWALAERVRGDRPVQEVEWVLRTREGVERVFAIENRLLKGPDGQVVGIRGSIQDITRRKQTEAALMASERRLRALFEGIEDAVFVHDLEGKILDANPAACRRLGYTREEFLRLSTRDIDDPEFGSSFGDRLENQLRHGRLSCEGRHRTKDGRVIPVDINSSLIQLEEQTAVLAVIREITERKALEETRRQFAEAQMRHARAIEAKAHELARSEARYRQFNDSLLDAVVVTDAGGRITLFNRAAERTFGYRAAEVQGTNLRDLITDAPAGADREAAAVPSLQQALIEGDTRVVGRTVEATGRRRSGELFPLEISLAAVEIGDDGPAEFIGSIRDLTERNRMRAMLLQSEKLASIGLLSAGVAHEINNPLAYIANNLAVLERDLAGLLELVGAYESARPVLEQHAPETAARIVAIEESLDWAYVQTNLNRILARTRDGVQRVAKIVQDLRGLARTSPPTKEWIALTDLVDSALDMVAPRLKRDGISVEFERPTPPLPKIACVPTQVGQVFLNMLVNAAQAIEEGRPAEGGKIWVTVSGDPGEQAVEIADNGIGIDPASIPRLFDPFYTTKPVGEGTGLGLSISHGIVTGHGGRIEVDGAPGKGARFRIVLPAVAEPAQPGV